MAVPAAAATASASRATSTGAAIWTGNWPPAWSSTSLKPSGDEVNDSSMGVPSTVPKMWNV